MAKGARTALLAGLSVIAASWAPGAFAQSLAISCGAVGMELRLCQEGAAAWSAQSGIPVDVVSTPNSTSERLALYQQLLASGSGDIDVFQIDVIWPGILGTHFLDLSDAFSADEIGAHFDAIVANNTIDGELKAIPWFTDAGVLYYRRDLLEAHGHDRPGSWEEMAAIAADIQAKERAAGNDRMQGFVFQGNAYEGLTCNALEWIDAWGGGQIIEPDGTTSVNNPRAVAAIAEAASWIGTISPRGVLSYQEEEARGVFQSGHAVFMRNWPYAWALGNAPESPISGKIGVMALPPGGEDGQATGVLGGWNLAVSRYSNQPEAAKDLVRFLASFEEQKRRAIVGAYNPTIAALYENQEVLEANPFFGDLYDTFTNAVARPSAVTGTRYNQVSTEFWNAVHRALSGQATAEAALADLERRLQRLARGWQ
ncbi:MAG: ABC transporter substrate-binding protein [Geminicoccaceae bacterium]|nr:MAG: ABC transporter substrate-binding protein [Geminicoccaceae bacterium]